MGRRRGYDSISIKPINARYVRKPHAAHMDQAIVAGPFECRHVGAGIKVSFYLRHMGRDEGSNVVLNKSFAIAYAKGVVESAMKALWGADTPKLEFSENGQKWKIVWLKLKAKAIRPE